MLLQIAVAVTIVSIVAPSKDKTVPLKEIWALRMPNTRDIRKLDPPKQPNADTAISRINEILVINSSRGIKSGKCFLVLGDGKQALLNAADILAGKKTIPKTMPSGEPLTLFFYSQPAPGYVHIDSARREESALKLNYKVIVHQTAESTVHFALVPIGKLLAGKFKVDINELKPPTPYRNIKKAERAVCDPCTFIIKEEEVP